MCEKHLFQYSMEWQLVPKHSIAVQLYICAFMCIFFVEISAYHQSYGIYSRCDSVTGLPWLIPWNINIQSLEVFGVQSTGKCGRLSQFSCWASSSWLLGAQ